MFVHPDRLERWLGQSQVATISDAMREFYAPIPVAGVPGHVVAYKGDFIGHIDGGAEASLEQKLWDLRMYPENRWRVHDNIHAGFTSLSDLISEATTGGKLQSYPFSKVGSLAVSGSFESLWGVGNIPAAGGNPGTLDGANPTNATGGALAQNNAAGGDTLHLTSLFAQGSAASNTMLLYDRLWHGLPNMNSNVAQAITMSLTRYATTTSPGNFAFVEVTSVLANTAHNIQIKYTDQAGGAAEQTAARAGIAQCAATRLDHGTWYIPLNAGDNGFRTITEFLLSAAVATGAANLVAGHPLAFVPCPVANAMTVLDCINSAFNLQQILDNACLAFLGIKGVATATTYNGMVNLVSG